MSSKPLPAAQFQNGLSDRAAEIDVAGLAELPLLGYLFSRDRTAATVVQFRAWLHGRGRTIAVAMWGRAADC